MFMMTLNNELYQTASLLDCKSSGRYVSSIAVRFARAPVDGHRVSSTLLLQTACGIHSYQSGFLARVDSACSLCNYPKLSSE
jgi:hypothetical protein